MKKMKKTHANILTFGLSLWAAARKAENPAAQLSPLLTSPCLAFPCLAFPWLASLHPYQDFVMLMVSKLLQPPVDLPAKIKWLTQ